MTDQPENETLTPDDNTPIAVTFDMPSFLLERYKRLVERGFYLNLGEAFRAAVLEHWRYAIGSYCRVRLDIGDGEEPSDTDETDGGAGAAGSEGVTGAGTGRDESGDAASDGGSSDGGSSDSGSF